MPERLPGRADGVPDQRERRIRRRHLLPLWKLRDLGPLIGTRTWGGVVGIWPQQSLVDGTVTTQPEFRHWFSDVGYAVENFGTVPDIEVVNSPADYQAGFDPQLEVGLEELKREMEKASALPEFGDRPSTRAS